MAVATRRAPWTGETSCNMASRYVHNTRIGTLTTPRDNTNPPIDNTRALAANTKEPLRRHDPHPCTL